MDWIEDLTRSWMKEHPQLDVSHLPAVLRLARLGLLIESFQSDVLGPFELTPSDYGVLATLHRTGRPHALNPSRLYAELGRSSGGMTKILKRLERAGLVERKPDPEDGRSVRVSLTARGLTLFERVFRAFAAASSRLLSAIPDRQLNEIDDALKTLLVHLESHGGTESGA